MPEVMTCPTISDKFLQKWTFPHTCGAPDGKDITCKCPPKSGSQYFNYKGFYSVVLMAIGDANCTGTALIYNNSENKELAEDETIRFPAPDPLPNDYQDVPYFFTGDDAFAHPGDHDEAIQP